MYGAFNELNQPQQVSHQPQVYLAPRVGDGLLDEVGRAAPLHQLVVGNPLDDVVARELVRELSC